MLAGERSTARRFAGSGEKKLANGLEKMSGEIGKMVSRKMKCSK
jgi:hypothetical protein